MTDNFRAIIEDMDNKQFSDLMYEIDSIQQEIEGAKKGGFGSKRYLEERFDNIARVLEFEE